MSSDPLLDLPYFQQLQQQFAAHIRNPETVAYAPSKEKPIEARRLQAYQELFFNNLEGFFTQIFPVCVEIISYNQGRERWLQIIREYMVKHDSHTPLFHELGEEFLLFLESEFQPLESDPPFLLELAHYEWVELALTVSTEVGFDAVNEVDEASGLVADLDHKYTLSPVAWPLAYEWPVHQLSTTFQPTEKPETVTTLLVYRHEDEEGTEVIDFMTLTPLLYQWLVALEQSDSARMAFENVAELHQLTADSLQHAIQEVLNDLVNLNILRAVDKIPA